MAIKINEQHLGDEATRKNALDMIQCLKSEGIDVEYGTSLPRNDNERADSIPDSVWEKCLETTNKLEVIDRK